MSIISEVQSTWCVKQGNSRHFTKTYISLFKNRNKVKLLWYRVKLAYIGESGKPTGPKAPWLYK